MDSLTESLDLLSWSTTAVNHVRDLLAELNITLPSFLAQLMALLILGLVGWFLIGAATKAERSKPRLAARVGLAGAGVAGLAIVAAWIDNLAVPRSEEIVGHVVAPTVGGLQIDLLDYRGESLGPYVRSDLSGAFVVRYTPAFADPPSALLVEAMGCQPRRQPLRRSHLLGAELTVHMNCGRPDA